MDSMEQPTVATRKALSRRLRYEILRRDDNTCRYCGGKAPDVVLTIDHVVPVALGGTDDPANLVAACRDCNAGKTSSTPDAALVAQAGEDALRWSAAMQVAAGSALESVREVNAYADEFDRAWASWSYGWDKRPIPRPENWKASAKSWKAAGLPIELLVDAVEVACGSDRIPPASTWKYMCGIAWKRVTELQEAARLSLSEPEGEGKGDQSSLTSEEWHATYWSGFSHALAEPEVATAFRTFKCLSRVVDGAHPWNRASEFLS